MHEQTPVSESEPSATEVVRDALPSGAEAFEVWVLREDISELRKQLAEFGRRQQEVIESGNGEILRDVQRLERSVNNLAVIVARLTRRQEETEAHASGKRDWDMQGL